MKKLGSAFDAFVETNILKYSDPIDWSISTQYEANTIVRNGEDVYLSKQAVPAGVAVTHPDYWFKVGDLSTYQLQLDTIRHQIAADDEGNNVNASKTYAEDSIFWLNGYLSEAVTTITVGQTFVLNENYKRVTVIELLDDLDSKLTNHINTVQSSLDSDITRLEAITGSSKRIICIGDSIAHGTNPGGVAVASPWPVLLRDALHLTSGSSFYVSAHGGEGFMAPGDDGNHTFLQNLQELENVVTNKDTITDIYVIGGVNDVRGRYTEGQITAAMATFCSYCKTHYPNALVHISCIAYFSKQYIYGASLIEDVHRAYMSGLQDNAVYIPNVVSAMCDFANYNNDGFHVLQPIDTRIAQAIINDGAGCMYSIMAENTGTPTEVFSKVLVPNAFIKPSYIEFFHDITDVTINTPTEMPGYGRLVKMGDLTTSGICGFSWGGQNWVDNIQQIPISGFAQDVNDVYGTMYGYISIRQGQVYIYARAFKANGWLGNLKSLQIARNSGVVPII